MLKGITVQLLEKTPTGVDDAGKPVFKMNTVDVDNVLVAPLSANEFQDVLNKTGHRATYQLGIPKTDTHTWEGKRVRFWGQTWVVIGIPTQGIDDLIPGPWNKKVNVDRYLTEADPAWTDLVWLLAETREKDAAGYDEPTAAEKYPVFCVFTEGVNREDQTAAMKNDVRLTATVELCEGDYSNERLVEHNGSRYRVSLAKPTGRGTMLLYLTEVLR